MKKTLISASLVILFLSGIASTRQTTSLSGQAKEVVSVKIENTLKIWRKDEVIELDWAALLQKNSTILSAPFVVESNGKQLPYQIISHEAQKPVKLLVQLCVGPETSVLINLKKGTPETFKTKTFGRYVPERKDDFAWENDKIAFRMYGPALQATGEVSSGIDVWVKRTPELIIDKWFKLNDYHVDHGEGMDCYKVGPTLGAGGIAPYKEGKLFYSKNWATYKVISSGVLRTVFELTYAPWQFNGAEISETKRITLNAGSQLNQVEVTYKTNVLDSIPVAIGIIKRPQSGIMQLNEKSGYISYWEPATEVTGTTGLGVVLPEHKGMSIVENQLVVFTKAANQKTLKYFQGACWDRAGEYRNALEWSNYLEEYALKTKTPLLVTIQ